MKIQNYYRMFIVPAIVISAIAVGSAQNNALWQGIGSDTVTTNRQVAVTKNMKVSGELIADSIKVKGELIADSATFNGTVVMSNNGESFIWQPNTSTPGPAHDLLRVSTGYFNIMGHKPTQGALLGMGINTQTPSRMLDVNGTARIRNLFTAAPHNFMVTAETDGTLHQIAFPNDATKVLLGNGTFGAGPAPVTTWILGGNTNAMQLNNSNIIGTLNSNDLRLFAGNSQRGLIDWSTGFWAIGPANFTPNNLLDVNGGDIDVNTSDKGYMIADNYVLLHKGNTTNLFAGVGAGNANTLGYNNTFVGNNAGASNTGNAGGAGGANTFIGGAAGYNNCPLSLGGYENTFIGYGAGFANTLGHNNTFVGRACGLDNTTGNYNTFIGDNAARNTVGSFNTFTGYQAGNLNFIGEENSFYGYQAGFNNYSGKYNTLVGTWAGGSNETGNYNIYCGWGTGPSGTNKTALVNAGAIGAYATVAKDYSLVLGAINGENGYLGPVINVGIGTTEPQNQLEVTGPTGPTGNISGLRLTNLAGVTGPTGNGNVLSVDADGDVILVRDEVSGAGAVPAPPISSVQFNDNGVFGGSSNFVWDGASVGIGTDMPSQKLQLHNGNLLLSNNGTSAELRFAEPNGADYTAFKAQLQVNSVTYTLPAADGTSGQILSTDGTGNLNWQTVSGGGGGPGNGIFNYLPKWDASGSALTATSKVYDDGTNVGIGTNNLSARLHIKGLGNNINTNSLYIERSDGYQILQLTDEGSCAIGVRSPSTSLGNNAISLGFKAEASNSDAFAAGNQAIAKGNGSIAMGSNSTTGTTAISSIALGAGNSINDYLSGTFGHSNSIFNPAYNSFAFGSGNIILKPTSFAIGQINEINGGGSYIFGKNGKISEYAYEAMLIGIFPGAVRIENSVPRSIMFGVMTDQPALIITSGNNIPVADGGTRGKVGINTNSPMAQLDVVGDIHVDGDISGTGYLKVPSDIRLKKDTVAFRDGLNVIRQTNPIFYKWNGKAGIDDTSSQFVGVIGQEILQIAPYLIDTFYSRINDMDDSLESEIPLLKVSSQPLLYAAINAIKQLDSAFVAVSATKDSIDSLRQQIAILQDQMTQIQNCINNLPPGMCGNARRADPDSSELGVVSSEIKQTITLQSSDVAILYQNEPNPFGNSTIIRYYISEGANEAMLVFYDEFGREMLKETLKKKGYAYVDILTEKLASGIYTYSLTVDEKVTDTKKMIRAK